MSTLPRDMTAFVPTAAAAMAATAAVGAHSASSFARRTVRLRAAALPRQQRVHHPRTATVVAPAAAAASASASASAAGDDGENQQVGQEADDDEDVAAFEAAAAAAGVDDAAAAVAAAVQTATGDSKTNEQEGGQGQGQEEDDDEEWDGVVQELQPPQRVVNDAAIADARGRFKRHDTDTGSPEYQVATLTTRINYLTTHLRANPKDFSSTRGLVALVSRRRRLLKYLKSEDPARFQAILDGMQIRVSQELRAM